MRNASAALIALLNSGTEFAIADLLTIVLADGTIVRLTNAGPSITAVSQYDNASHTFIGGTVQFRRGPTKLVVGLEVDAMSLTLMTTGQTLSGLPWPQQARQGAFDEARVMLERLFMPSWTDVSAGTMIEFWGRVGSVKPSRNMIEMMINSDLELLAMPMPRNVYQTQCLHTLYDAGCGLFKSVFTVVGIAASGSTVNSLRSNRTEADGYFELGAVKFTSGQNNGITRTVKTYLNSNGEFKPSVPFPYAPANGDTFTAYPGCDKVIAVGGNVNSGTCKVKFNNLANAKGFPYIPTPENAR